MPKHITNVLDVTGPAKLVTAFKNKVYRMGSKAKGDEEKVPIFDFNTTVPCPASMHITCPARTNKEKETYAENKAKYKAGDWYEWDCKYWGTKWNAYSACEPEEIESGLRFRFDTAWCPPTQWIASTAEQFPRLTFRDRWIDEGGGAGDLQVQTVAGEVQVSEDNMSDHDWRIEFDSGYREEYEDITEGDYDELIKRYVVDQEEFMYGDLQIYFVNRIKDKDLPLLTGLDLYDEAKARIEERLKETKPTVKKRTRKG